MATVLVDGRQLPIIERDGKLMKVDVSTYVGGDYAVNAPMEVWVREDQIGSASFATLRDHASPSEDWRKTLALNARVDENRLVWG